LPLLLLGGPARGTPEETLRDFAAGLSAGGRVRGAIIGRHPLYPGAGGPLPLCRALTPPAHGRAPPARAPPPAPPPRAPPRRAPPAGGPPPPPPRRPDVSAGALDVCVLGRVGYDLYAMEQGRPLAAVEHFSRHLGGSSANIAVGLARLGKRVAIVSAVGDDPLADYLIGFLGPAGAHAR